MTKEKCEHNWKCYDWMFYEFRHRIDLYICTCSETRDEDHRDVYPQPPSPPISGTFYKENTTDLFKKIYDRVGSPGYTNSANKE